MGRRKNNPAPSTGPAAALASSALADGLRELIRHVVREVLDQVGGPIAGELKPDGAGTDGKLLFSEPEAARLLGMTPRQLREIRYGGRIQFTLGPKRSARYSRAQLDAFIGGTG